MNEQRDVSVTPKLRIRRWLNMGFLAEKTELLETAYKTLDANAMNISEESRRQIENDLYDFIKLDDDVSVETARTFINQSLEQHEMLLPPSLFKIS